MVRSATLVLLGLLLGAASEARAADLRFVSLKPAATPAVSGEWTAIVEGAKSAGELAFRADGAPVAALGEGSEGGRLRVRLQGVPAGAGRIEVGPAKGKGGMDAAVAVGTRSTPFSGLSIYHVMVGMFANGSKGNDGEVAGWKHPNYAGGDLQGVLERAPYLQELGVNAVWLSPVFLARTSHGYDVQNYYKLGNAVAVPGDPGASLELFRKLVTDLHGRGIKVILDIPLNHANAAYERDATGDPEGLKPRATGARQEAEKVWESWGGGYRYWSFDHQPTRQFLKNSALFWLIREGVDGLRLDYVRGVPHDFWAELYADVKKAKPEAFLVGEAWTDQQGAEGNAKDIATYYEKVGGTPQFDSLLDFPLQMVMTEVFAKGVPATGLEASLQRTEAVYGPGALPTYFLDNHDMARFMAWTDKPERLAAAVGFLASLSNPLVLFYGTETGLSHGSPKTGFTDVSRIPMPWNDLNTALGAQVRQALAARRSHPALTRGGRLPLLAERDILVMAKVAAEETALVGVNLGGEPREVTLDVAGLFAGETNLAPVLGTAPATVSPEGQLRWKLPAMSTVVVAVKR